MQTQTSDITKASVLEKYIDMAQHNIFCFSRNYAMTEPKEGFEKEWQDAKKKFDELINIAKIVDKYEKAPVGETRERMIEVVNCILSKSADVSLTVDGNEARITVVDGIERKYIAVLSFEKFLDHLILKDYQLF